MDEYQLQTYCCSCRHYVIPRKVRDVCPCCGRSNLVNATKSIALDSWLAVKETAEGILVLSSAADRKECIKDASFAYGIEHRTEPLSKELATVVSPNTTHTDLLHCFYGVTDVAHIEHELQYKSQIADGTTIWRIIKASQL